MVPVMWITVCIFMNTIVFTIAHASVSDEARSITGIPIDLLFTLIAVLVGLIWGDMRRQQRQQTEHLQKQLDGLAAQHKARSRTLNSLQTAVLKICWKLNLSDDLDTHHSGDEG